MSSFTLFLFAVAAISAATSGSISIFLILVLKWDNNWKLKMASNWLIPILISAYGFYESYRIYPKTPEQIAAVNPAYDPGPISFLIMVEIGIIIPLIYLVTAFFTTRALSHWFCNK